ncbi:unnamed protein product [Rotaria sp. Silwood1]|nr:unnamed protein product [Rotaria sp. Silwood1]
MDVGLCRRRQGAGRSAPRLRGSQRWRRLQLRGPRHRRPGRAGHTVGAVGGGSHAADVRRGAALLGWRPDVGEEHRAARRARADGCGHGDGCRPGALVVGLGPGGVADLRPGAVGGQHGGAAARAGVARATAHRQRPYRRRLAHRGRPGHGAGAGADPGARCQERRWLARQPRRHHRHDAAGRRRFRRRHADRRPAPVAVDAVAGQPHRLARAVHAGHRGRGRRPGGGRGGAVRRQRRAGRVLRGPGAARVGLQRARGAREPAAARRVRRAVFRCRRHAVRPAHPDPAAARRAGDRGRHPRRQDGGGWCAGAAAALPVEHGADGGRQPRADRRVQLHPAGPGPEPEPRAARGDQPGRRRCHRLHRAEPGAVLGRRAAAPLGAEALGLGAQAGGARRPAGRAAGRHAGKRAGRPDRAGGPRHAGHGAARRTGQPPAGRHRPRPRRRREAPRRRPRRRAGRGDGGDDAGAGSHRAGGLAGHRRDRRARRAGDADAGAPAQSCAALRGRGAHSGRNAVAARCGRGRGAAVAASVGAGVGDGGARAPAAAAPAPRPGRPARPGSAGR